MHEPSAQAGLLFPRVCYSAGTGMALDGSTIWGGLEFRGGSCNWGGGGGLQEPPLGPVGLSPESSSCTGGSLQTSDPWRDVLVLNFH